jgi:hypothetical protein
MYVRVDRFTFLIIYRCARDWLSSQVVNVLVVGPVQLFPFPWFAGGCVISSCWLRFVVVLCFRGLFPCVLIDFPRAGGCWFCV